MKNGFKNFWSGDYSVGKGLVAESGDLCSIPRVHAMERNNQLLLAVLWPSHIHHGMCDTHTHKYIKHNKIYVFTHSVGYFT